MVDMGKNCQVDDNVSSSDQISHGFASSVSDNKTSKHNSSDVSSEIGQPLREKRKSPSAGTAEEISQGNSIVTAPYPHKQLKTDSSSSKNSGALGQLSSVDYVDSRHAHSLNNIGYSHPTLSVESKKVFQEMECSITTRSDPNGASMQNTCYEFGLNEGMKANRHLKSVHESNYSSNVVLSEPIPVVAKMGVPTGFPKKPLQFGGELGWKRSGSTSAFRPADLMNLDTEKAPVSRGHDFDLNIAATMDPEVLVNEPSVYASSKKTQRFHFDSQRENDCRHRPATSGIDLNHDPMIEDPCISIYPQGETQQFFQNCDTVDSASRPPYWVDLGSVQGFGNVQGQPFLLGASSTDQVQMMIPIQLPYTAPGFYIGKMNSLTPTNYPPNGLPTILNQPGPVLAAYPGNVRLLESSQGLNLNPHGYTNMRQTILSNGSTTLLENARNPLVKTRMKPVEQVMCLASQINCRQMASWN